jgi:hypothetical protein
LAFQGAFFGSTNYMLFVKLKAASILWQLSCQAPLRGTSVIILDETMHQDGWYLWTVTQGHGDHLILFTAVPNSQNSTTSHLITQTKAGNQPRNFPLHHHHSQSSLF